MIVHPNWLDHWKTLQLVELTGDAAAPLSVLRLWSHCQSSRRWEFPGMTPAQLASVCRWGDRKPACCVALVKAGFVDRLPGGGFAAHEWGQHNGQYVQKWDAGKKGGRPSREEKANNGGQISEPDDNRSVSGGNRSGGKPSLAYPIRAEQSQVQSSPSEPPSPPLPSGDVQSAPDGEDSASRKLELDGGIGGLVAGLANQTRVKAFREPSQEEVRRFLALQFDGAEKWAPPFWKAMRKQHWKDANGVPINDWHQAAIAYAKTCEMKARGQT